MFLPPIVYWIKGSPVGSGFWASLFVGILLGVFVLISTAVAYSSIKENKARSKKDQAIKGPEQNLKLIESEQKRKVDEVTSSARSKKDQAVAYIEREYQDFNMHLCQRLDKLQSFVDTWTTENANVTSVLDKKDIQNIGKNNE